MNNHRTNITDWSAVPVIFDVAMASRLLGMTVDGVAKRCQRGMIPAFKDGKSWRFEKEVFLDYIRQRSVCRMDAGAG